MSVETFYSLVRTTLCRAGCRARQRRDDPSLRTLPGQKCVHTALPHIVLILADDLGFSDIAPLAARSAHLACRHWPRRGLVLPTITRLPIAPRAGHAATGVDAHLAGVPNIPEMLAPEQRRYEHYQGVLGHNVVTVATLLEDAGYHTYMAGSGISVARPACYPAAGV